MDNCKTPPIRTPTANAVIGSAKKERNAKAEKIMEIFSITGDKAGETKRRKEFKIPMHNAPIEITNI